MSEQSDNKEKKCENVTWVDTYLSRSVREEQHGHKGAVIWFTGLSASGKSTIAHHLEKLLHSKSCHTYVLDGDNVRHGLNKDLGFSAEDRAENIRRIGEVVKLFFDAATIVVTAFISPYRRDRKMVRSLIEPGQFLEVYVKCPIEVCKDRDPKKLYEKAQAGIIKSFTGVSDPYEEPLAPEIVIETDKTSPEDAAQVIFEKLREFGIINHHKF